MSRVLVTGGVGRIGSAVVRRLLRDPDFEVRVSDRRPPPVWMREGAEVHNGDLRLLDEARKALRGCSHVIHLAAYVDGSRPFTQLEVNAALDIAVVRAALDADVERCTCVVECGRLLGEVLCRAAHAEHGLRYTICRPFGVYGPGLEHPVLELLRAALAGGPLAGDSDEALALTYVDDVADAIVLATAAPEAVNQAFDIVAYEPLRAVAAACWAACGNAPETLVLKGAPAPPPSLPETDALEQTLGWHPRTAPADGIARTLASLDHLPGGH